MPMSSPIFPGNRLDLTYYVYCNAGTFMTITHASQKATKMPVSARTPFSFSITSYLRPISRNFRYRWSAIIYCPAVTKQLTYHRDALHSPLTSSRDTYNIEVEAMFSHSSAICKVRRRSGQAVLIKFHHVQRQSEEPRRGQSSDWSDTPGHGEHEERPRERAAQIEH